MRKANVSKLFESTHALKGDIDGPVWRVKVQLSTLALIFIHKYWQGETGARPR